MAFPLPDELRRILFETPGLDQAYLVGGCVRNWRLGLPVEDFDVEVYGTDYNRLASMLAVWGRTDQVGRSFGVVKLTTRSGLAYDFTVPRRDSKTGPGHKGFTTAFDAGIAPREAAARRDYTINSMMYDPRREEVLDYYGGERDLKEGWLRHTTAAFTEDPLRVLRGMQLAGRFDLRAAPETAELCRSIADHHDELARERIWDEWFKWACKSRKPSSGLRFLQDTGWLCHYPEVAAMVGTEQDPEWHPEGDVFVHTGHCCDALTGLAEWQALPASARGGYMFAVLTHDIAKPLVTHRVVRDGRERIVSPGHEEAGGPLADAFLERIHAPRAVREHVGPLVTNHLAHLQTTTDRAVRRLARRLDPETIQGLALVMTADHFGRPPLPKVVPDSVTRLVAMAEALALTDAAPKPILMGRHLVAHGFRPGPNLGKVLHEAFEAQLEGHFETLAQAHGWLLSTDDLPLPRSVRESLSRSGAEAFGQPSR